MTKKHCVFAKRHFIRLAGLMAHRVSLAETYQETMLLVGMAQDIANMCAEQNPRFNRSRWYQAAGVGDYLKGE